MNINKELQSPIQTIEALITELTDEERTDYAEIIKSIQIPTQTLEEYSSWSSDCYTRNCLIENEQLELILLCWEKGQETPIHDHGGEECWVKVVQGELKETIYETCDVNGVNKVRTTVAHNGEVTYMVDFMGCHRLENVAKGRSMSLHLYAKPIKSCQLFDEDSKTFFRKEMSYDTCL